MQVNPRDRTTRFDTLVRPSRTIGQSRTVDRAFWGKYVDFVRLEPILGLDAARSGADKYPRAVLKATDGRSMLFLLSSHQTRIPRVVPDWLAGSALLASGCASNSSSRRCGRIEPGATR